MTAEKEWLYPEPLADLQAYHDSKRIDAAAPKIVHWLYWPDGRYLKKKESLDILIAGCGANAAARYAFEHPKCNVTGIDTSEAALEHGETLRKRHNLKNLTLKQMPLAEAAKMGEDFDFIECIGVLPHVDDPLGAIKALKKVLRPDGVMAVMVYGRYGRTGVTMLQELFRDRLGLKAASADIEVIKSMLPVLNPLHPLAQFRQTSTDLNFDAGLVELFLRDDVRHFAVEDCLALAAESDLTFQGWLDNFYYYPDGQIPASRPVYDRIQALPDREKWAAMELYSGAVYNHTFYLCHPKRSPRSYTLDFETEAFMAYIPHQRITHFEPPKQGQNATIRRLPFAPVPLTDLQLAIIGNCDGKTTIREALEKGRIQGDPETLRTVAGNFFRSLWQIGYVMFEIPAAK